MKNGLIVLCLYCLGCVSTYANTLLISNDNIFTTPSGLITQLNNSALLDVPSHSAVSQPKRIYRLPLKATSQAKTSNTFISNSNIYKQRLTQPRRQLLVKSSASALNWQQFALERAQEGTGVLLQRVLMKKTATKMAIKTTLSVGRIMGRGGSSVLSYGNYLLGSVSWQQAQRDIITDLTVAGVSTATSAALAGGTALTFATTIAGWIGATASTGTAIASLSGIAATNATLAALGGGTLAAGGGGVAAGTVVLAGISATGVGIIAAGVAAGVMSVFYLKDKKTERQRLNYLLNGVQKHFRQPIGSSSKQTLNEQRLTSQKGIQKKMAALMSNQYSISVFFSYLSDLGHWGKDIVICVATKFASKWLSSRDTSINKMGVQVLVAITSCIGDYFWTEVQDHFNK